MLTFAYSIRRKMPGKLPQRRRDLRSFFLFISTFFPRLNASSDLYPFWAFIQGNLMSVSTKKPGYITKDFIFQTLSSKKCLYGPYMGRGTVSYFIYKPYTRKTLLIYVMIGKAYATGRDFI